MLKFFYVSSIFISIISIIIMVLMFSQEHSEKLQNSNVPTVMVTMLVRNKAHVLPYFLYYFQNLDYPKDKMRLWISCDHNADNSVNLFKKWLQKNEHLYQNVYISDYYLETEYKDAANIYDWSRSRFETVIYLRQSALEEARRVLADYLLYLDLDNFLINDQTLKILINENKTVIAPMLITSSSYSNFWGAMTRQGYYKRSDDYLQILKRKKLGTFKVPMVHSTFLIQIKSTKNLSFAAPTKEYDGPYDDIIIFAYSAAHHQINLYITNSQYFGFMLLPYKMGEQGGDEVSQFLHIRLQNIVDDSPLKVIDDLKPAVKSTTLGFDKIYTINLKRRADRRKKMLACYTELGIESQFVDAVDGSKLTQDALKKLNIKMLPNYTDPYYLLRSIKKPMTLGEIGCFLSHYYIWQDIVNNNYEKAIIFEDDIRFEIYFHQKLELLMSEVNQLKITWDLIFLGRKGLIADRFNDIKMKTLVLPDYSHWAIGYMLSLQGARKLLDADPLSKMIPVDEYIPIMYNSHPVDEWKKHFGTRNLIAYSADPLLVEPMKYSGQPGYNSDTEYSPYLLINKNLGSHGNDDGNVDKTDFKMI